MTLIRGSDRFQALRERYDQVAAVHDAHERDLEIAAQKMKSLQAENECVSSSPLSFSHLSTSHTYVLEPTLPQSLLLDAIHITAPHLVHLATPIQAATPEQNLNGSRRPPPEVCLSMLPV